MDSAEYGETQVRVVTRSKVVVGVAIALFSHHAVTVVEDSHDFIRPGPITVGPESAGEGVFKHRGIEIVAVNASFRHGNDGIICVCRKRNGILSGIALTQTKMRSKQRQITRYEAKLRKSNDGIMLERVNYRFRSPHWSKSIGLQFTGLEQFDIVLA